MPNFTAGTSFTDGVTNDVTAAKLNALIADAVPTSSLSLNSTTGTISQFSSGTGTAASPAIQPTGDTNTGIFFPAADTIAFSEGGTESMRIDSSGRVGIGTSSPAYSLEVAVGTSGQQSIANFRTADSTAANNAGIQIFATPSSTAASRNVKLVFDSDGANASGGDYFIITKDGNSGAVSLDQQSNSAMTFNTNSTERLRIDSSGNVGIGGSPSTLLNIIKDDRANGAVLRLTNSAESSSWVSGDIIGDIDFFSSDSSGSGVRGRIRSVSEGGATNPNSVAMSFWTYSGGNVSERLRITSGGSILAGATSAQNSERLLAQNDSATNPSFIAYSSSATFAGYVTRIFADRNTSNSTYNFLSCVRVGSAGDVLIVRDSGNVVNTNNSYGAISDIKLKENIENASSQWNDIKSIQVRKFSFKNDEEHKRMLGLVAQEVELISPHLVETVIDRDKDGNDLGTTTKEVKYSVLYMKAVKALQEAMERIEQLETKVAILEAA